MTKPMDDTLSRLASIETQLDTVRSNQADAASQHRQMIDAHIDLTKAVTKLEVVTKDLYTHQIEFNSILKEMQGANGDVAKLKDRVSALERGRVYIFAFAAGVGATVSLFVEFLPF